MNAEALVRHAVPADLHRIQAIEAAAFGEDAFSRRQLRYLMTRAKGACFVAVGSGGVVGYLSALVSARHGNGRIYSLVVAPESRGQGIAESLIAAALNFLRARNARTVFLEVRADNLAAQTLYKKAGFLPRSVKPGYYHDGADAQGMARPVE